MSKSNKVEVEDTRWKFKGGPMKERRAEPMVCPVCDGFAKIRQIKYDPHMGSYVAEEPCDNCGGTGEHWK